MIRLIKVEAGENNNKFYNMEKKDDGTFNANYGRVGATSGQNKIYSQSEWDRIYRQKIKKGYQDISEISSVGKKSSGLDAGSAQPIVDFLMNSANKSIADNYLVGADSVTQSQISTAQDYLNEIASILSGKKDPHLVIDGVNSNLQSLYTTIPRKMGKVIDHMASTIAGATEILTLEQANVDVMKGSVVQPKKVDGQNKLSDLRLGVSAASAEDVAKLIKPRLSYLSGNFKKAWKITNEVSQNAYNDNYAATDHPEQMLLWHGSRNENWWSIINQGLLIRPTNAVHTGSMFGDGLYFADYDRKSYGYTSGTGSYWAGGSSNKAILALYDVHVGRQYIVNQHNYRMSSMNWKSLKREGDYLSLFAQKGVSLRNNEYIVYRPEQCTIKYLVEVES